MQEYVQLIYNPMAGARIFPTKLDYFIEVFNNKGYEVRIKRTQTNADFLTFFENRDFTGCAAIFVAGGDGSVNQVINGMLHNGVNLPIGVIPAGTANDFANHMNMPMNISEAILRLSEMNIQTVDVGKANDRYFINVCCGGLFTNVSQNIDIELKNTLGKLAYYIKGVQQLPRFKGVRFRIKSENVEIEDTFFLFLLLNGSSAGGFGKLAKNATLDDGLMDFIAIKECPLNYIPTLFGKIIIGEHLEDKHIVYFQTKKVLIEGLEGLEGFEESDIDGESGPIFPLDIEVREKILHVIH